MKAEKVCRSPFSLEKKSGKLSQKKLIFEGKI